MDDVIKKYRLSKKSYVTAHKILIPLMIVGFCVVLYPEKFTGSLWWGGESLMLIRFLGLFGFVGIVCLYIACIFRHYEIHKDYLFIGSRVPFVKIIFRDIKFYWKEIRMLDKEKIFINYRKSPVPIFVNHLEEKEFFKRILFYLNSNSNCEISKKVESIVEDQEKKFE